MSLIPRWEMMTDDAKALTKAACFGAAILLAAFWLIRALIPWIILCLVAYLGYKWLLRST